MTDKEYLIMSVSGRCDVTFTEMNKIYKSDMPAKDIERKVSMNGNFESLKNQVPIQGGYPSVCDILNRGD